MLKFILQYRLALSKKKFPARWIYLLSAEQTVINGYPLLDFVYTQNTLTAPAETEIKLPGLFPSTTKGHKNFETISCGEFEDAQIYFSTFFNGPDPLLLAKLAAILWRKKHESYIKYDFKTASYKTYKSDKIARRFLKLKPQRLYAIFIWYAGCQNMLPKLFPTVYEKNASPSVGGTDILAFTKCIHAGAGVKNGSRNEIRMTKLYEFMFDMEQEAIKAKEILEAYDNLK